MEVYNKHTYNGYPMFGEEFHVGYKCIECGKELWTNRKPLSLSNNVYDVGTVTPVFKHVSELNELDKERIILKWLSEHPGLRNKHLSANKIYGLVRNSNFEVQW